MSVSSETVSGGQIGVDRAAFDWTTAQGVPHDGGCLEGRRGKDGLCNLGLDGKRIILINRTWATNPTGAENGA
jgi:hypothetical protein